MLSAGRILEGAQQLRDRKIETKALTSKLQGVNHHLNCLIQKRLRLDLEIQKTQKNLRKLQKRTKEVTSSARAVSETLSACGYKFLTENSKWREDEEELFLSAETSIAEADQLIKEAEGLLGPN